MTYMKKYIFPLLLLALGSCVQESDELIEKQNPENLIQVTLKATILVDKRRGGIHDEYRERHTLGVCAPQTYNHRQETDAYAIDYHAEVGHGLLESSLWRG